MDKGLRERPARGLRERVGKRAVRRDWEKGLRDRAARKTREKGL